MSGWMLWWLVGAVFCEGLLSVVAPTDRPKDRMASYIVALFFWPYFVILFAGKTWGALLHKMGLR